MIRDRLYDAASQYSYAAAERVLANRGYEFSHIRNAPAWCFRDCGPMYSDQVDIEKLTAWLDRQPESGV